jgi:hypothetical protein
MGKAGTLSASSFLRVELPWLTPEAAEEFAAALRKQLPTSASPTLTNRNLQRLSQELKPQRYVKLMASKVQGGLHRAHSASALQELEMNKFILLPTAASEGLRMALDPEAVKRKRKETIKTAIASKTAVELFYGTRHDAGRGIFPLSMHEWGLRGWSQAGHRSYRWDALWYAVPFLTEEVVLWGMRSKRGRFSPLPKFGRIAYGFEQARDLHIASSVHHRTGLRTFEVTVCAAGEPLLPSQKAPKRWWLGARSKDEGVK